jgi:hypothetical protein
MDDGRKGKWRVVSKPEAKPAGNVIEHAFEAETKPFDAKIAFKGKPKRNGKPWVDGSSGASWSDRFKQVLAPGPAVNQWPYFASDHAGVLAVFQF